MTNQNDKDSPQQRREIRTHRLRVYVTPAQKQAVVENASACGLTVSIYAKNIALGYRPTSILDLKEARKLIALKADLGRLGGLLKMWLTDPIQFNERYGEPIEELITKIAEAQDRLLAVIRRIDETTCRGSAQSPKVHPNIHA